MLQWIKKLPCQPIHLAILVVASYYSIHYFSFLAVLLLCSFLVACFFHQGKKVFFSTLSLLALFCLLFSIQKFRWTQESQDIPISVDTINLLPDTIEMKGDKLSFRGYSDGRLYQVFYKLGSEEEKEYFTTVTSVQRLKIDASIEEASGQRNFNGFDYKNYLYTQGIYQTVKIAKLHGFEPISSFHPRDILSSWRSKALVYSKKVFPSPMSHYVTGLLFGHLDSEFDQMGDLYSSLGIIHLFALSGMQVGFFVDKFRYILLRLGLTKERVNQLQWPFSVLYAGLTGFSISVVRSLIQKLFGNLGWTKLDNFAMTLLMCILVYPRFLMTVGGVLSFFYAFVLTVFDFETMDKWKKIVVENLAISVGVLPVLMLYFYQFQPLSILLTIAFSFLFDSLFLPALSLFFLLSPVFDFSWANFFFLSLEKLIMWVADIGLRPLVLGKPSLLCFLLFLLILMLIHDWFSRKKMLLVLSSILILLLFFTKHPLENEVTMVDIGQGDSFFIRDIWGRTLLIDVGGRVDFAGKENWQKAKRQSNAEQTLIPYLYSRGVGRIDSLVLTHTDTDHVGDVLEVAKAVEIGKIYVSPGSLTDPAFVETLRTINVPVHVVQVGDKLPICDAFLEVLYPSKKGDGENNDSIVLYGRLLQTNFLFTGDLEDGELELVKNYPNLPVDVLKAGHHGSKGSSYPEFLRHISPKIALISAGQNNRYKHPHQETLNRFEEEGIAVLRTDQQGAVRFKGWDNWKIEVVKE